MKLGKIILAIFFVFIVSGCDYRQTREVNKSPEINAAKSGLNSNQLENPQPSPTALPKTDITPQARNSNAASSPAPNDAVAKDLIQKCPEAWYVDNMPVIIDGGSKISREYLIIDGKRVELSQVDMEWVKANCQIQKQEVY